MHPGSTCPITMRAVISRWAASERASVGVVSSSDPLAQHRQPLGRGELRDDGSTTDVAGGLLFHPAARFRQLGSHRHIPRHGAAARPRRGLAPLNCARSVDSERSAGSRWPASSLSLRPRRVVPPSNFRCIECAKPIRLARFRASAPTQADLRVLGEDRGSLSTASRSASECAKESVAGRRSVGYTPRRPGPFPSLATPINRISSRVTRPATADLPISPLHN